MDISVHELAAVCSADCVIPQELIHKIDQLTHFFGSAFDVGKVSLCNETWDLIGKSLRFWENCSLLLSSTTYDETKLQVLVLIYTRVKNNWYYQDAAIKSNIKKYLCGESQKYGSAELTKTKQSLFRKINQIIVEILKYEWMNDWQNFLLQICEATYTNNANLAENYFDLLSVIFEDIFSDEQKLTSEEIKRIKQQILNHYNDIQRLFQRYLSVNVPPNTLKNCLEALNNLVLWVPPYYLYFGQITDKLIDLLENSGQKMEALSCLENILVLPNDEMVEGFLGKVYQKKRSIILNLLRSRTIQTNQQVTKKILSLILSFLEEQDNDLKKFGEKAVIIDSQSAKQNKMILQKLCEFTSLCEEEYEILGMYKYIAATSDQQIITKILQTIINIAPCPIDTAFYADQNILKIQSIGSPQYENDRKKYQDVIKNIVQSEQEAYFRFILQQFDQEILTACSLRKLCKLIWNFYYFLEVTSSQSHIQQRIFTISSCLLGIQEKAQHNLSLSRTLNLSTKTVYATKLGMILILNNKKCLGNDMFLQPFFCTVMKGFEDNNNFVKAVIAAISKNYSLIYKPHKKELNNKYMKMMSVRADRLEVDLKYVEMIGKWAIQKQQNFQFGFDMIKPLFQLYKKNVSNHFNEQLKGAADLERAKNQMFKAGLNLLELISTALPYFKDELIFLVMDQLSMIKQTTSLCELTGENAQSIRFYQLTAHVFASFFFELTEQQINKNQDVLFNQALQISGFILSALANQRVHEEICGAMLEYLGKFIYKMVEWEIDQQQKLQLIHKSITRVYSCNFTHESLGFTSFVQYVIKCKKLCYLQQEIIKQTLLQIFILANVEDQNKTMKAIQMFKCIFKDSMDSNNSQQMVYNYILDLVTQIYLIIVRLKSSLNYLKQYSDVLFMALVFIKNLKLKFSPEQIEDNMTQLLNQLMSATRKLYNQYSEPFMERIEKCIGFIFTLTSKQDFTDRMKDLVIILRRGY